VKINFTNEDKLAGHQWLTPVILTTQEAKTRRITIESYLGQIPNTKKGWQSGYSGKALA
jgi:hypothetical protein